MSKYDCSKTVDYAHEFTRMCDAGCGACPLHRTELHKGGCGLKKLTEETIAIVQKWSDEHPEVPKLTKKEKAFLDSFEFLDNKEIQKFGDKACVTFEVKGCPLIALTEDMFQFVEGSMSLKKLAELEVEDA